MPRIVAGVLAATVLLWGAHSHASTLTVPGTANIFGAGHGSPPNPAGTSHGVPGSGAGTLPVSLAVVGGQSVSFSSITGTVYCCSPFANSANPDGSTAAPTNVNSYGGISGIKAGTWMFLAGVFTDGTEPADPAPPRLDFTSLGTNFASLAPALDQTFFIGDGLTGTGSGARQTFVAPAGATRLYLGFADAYGFQGDPGYYGDNTGSYAVTPTPEPSALVLLGTGLAGLAGTVWRRARKR